MQASVAAITIREARESDAALLAELNRSVQALHVAALPEYFKVAVPIIRKYGGLFISDEVQAGWGRTGDKWFGIEHYGVDPDIMTMAKGIANGYAMVKHLRAMGARPVPVAMGINRASDAHEAARVHQRLSAVAARFLNYDLPLAVASVTNDGSDGAASKIWTKFCGGAESPARTTVNPKIGAQ